MFPAQSRIPLSEVRRRIEEALPEYVSVENIPTETIGIPLKVCAILGNNNFVEQEGILHMPEEIRARYNDLLSIFQRVVGRPGEEKYDNKGDSIFPWELHKVTVGGAEYYLGWVDPEGEDGLLDWDGEDSDYFKNLTLFPCVLIDLNR